MITSSGAEWFEHADLLPDPNTVGGPALMVVPDGLVAHGMNRAALVIDMHGRELKILGTEADLIADFGIDELAGLAWQLPPLVFLLSDPDPACEVESHTICDGITVSRPQPGLIAIAGSAEDGGAVILPLMLAWALVAEVWALLTRWNCHTFEESERLEAALQL